MAEATPGEIIGRNIRAVREAGLYTRSELAKRSGVSASTIEDVELGLSARPRRTTIEKLARGLGVDVERLMEGAGGDEAPKAEAPPSQRSLFNGLEEEQRRYQLEEIRQSYREEREGVEGYIVRWERWLETGGIPEEAVREFLVSARAWYPTLLGLLRSELTEITMALGIEVADKLPDEAKAESALLPLADRFWELGQRLTEVWAERYPEEKPPIDFQEHRDEMLRRRTA